MHWLDARTFPALPAPPPLADGAVHLWCWDATRPDAHELALGLLGAYASRAPEALPIRRTPYGKPLLDPACGLHFNLSHSGTLWALAVSAAADVGVDVEQPRRERPLLALAGRFFAPAETAALAKLPEVARHEAFYALWTCKEAVLKALGRGIAFGLERLEFALAEGSGEPLRLARIADEGGDAAQWRILRFAPASGAFGALAWHGPPSAVQGFRPA